MTADKGVFIIAEAGVNHNGSLDMAMEMVDAAAGAGADAIKFQTFVPENCVSEFAPKADYQLLTSDPSQSQLDMLRQLQLHEEHYISLFSHCRKQGIEFISTAFDLDSLALVARLGIKRLKISSGEIESGPLLLAAAQSGLPLLLSTGACGMADVETALGILAFGYLKRKEKPGRRIFAETYAMPEGRKILAEKVTLLHCTSEYPAPMSEINLKAISTLKQAFNLSVGYSDHSEGITAAVAAVALGAQVVEKHFTLDRALPGPDHKASLEPEGLTNMICAIRDVEQALGDGIKVSSPSERKNIPFIRKSLVAKHHIDIGELFSKDNLTFKRPAEGISPLDYWTLLDRRAEREYQRDEMIEI